MVPRLFARRVWLLRQPPTRTVILCAVSYIDLKPKPDWSIAAVAVHEAAHIWWFHQPEVSSIRPSLTVPNERHSWLVMARFLRGAGHLHT